MTRHEVGTHIDGDNPRIKCECGQEFPAVRHPVEPGELESPEWYAHLRRHRHRRYVASLERAKVILNEVDLNDPDSVAQAWGRLMKLVSER
jgi:hypothetical protein